MPRVLYQLIQHSYNLVSKKEMTGLPLLQFQSNESLFLILTMDIWVCLLDYRCPWKPKSETPGAGVTDNCELPSVGLNIEHESSARTAYACNPEPSLQPEMRNLNDTSGSLQKLLYDLRV